MRVCQFNFNNEADTFTVHLEEDGTVKLPGENGEIIAEYNSMEQLAEVYAQARDVKPNNLKNWILLENGDVFSFVLRAGTAGVDIDVCEVEDALEEAFKSLAGRYHPLNLARAKEQIMGDGSVDLTDALVHCTETAIARDVYDLMAEYIEGTKVPAVAAGTEVQGADNRTPIQEYLDDIAEVPGRLALIAVIVGLSADADREDIENALQTSYAFSNVDSLVTICHNAIADVIENGIGVESEQDAIMVITQSGIGDVDEDMKARLIATARLARRNAVNITEDIVGTSHIRHTARLVPLTELEGLTLYVRDNTPAIVTFSDTVDEELEAEKRAREAEENADAEDADVDINDDDDDDDEDENYGW